MSRASRPSPRRAAPRVDPALAAAVLEIEAHIAEAGWDQPARLYALVDTADAASRREPALAAAMGLDDAVGAGVADAGRAGRSCPPDKPLETVLESDHVARRGDRLRRRGRAAGAAAGRRRRRSPTTRPRPRSTPREHPDRQEVRIVAGATRAGSTYCALRLRAARRRPVGAWAAPDLVPGPPRAAARHPRELTGRDGTRHVSGALRRRHRPSRRRAAAAGRRSAPAR